MSDKAASFKKGTAGIAPVAVAGIDAQAGQLIGEDGRRYTEIEPNLWVSLEDSSVAYLGTGRHGGGIVLRALYVHDGGGWLNVTTGKPAPPGVRLPASG